MTVEGGSKMEEDRSTEGGGKITGLPFEHEFPVDGWFLESW